MAPRKLPIGRELGSLALAMLVTFVSGCALPFAGDNGQLRLDSQSAGQPQLSGNFDKAYYRFDSANRVTVVLLDGLAKSPRQAAIIRMFWQPFSGYTPIDPAATNATVQYVVFGKADNAKSQNASDVGVYSGAGFVYPNNSPGGNTLSAGVWQASVRLTDRSEKYIDLLGAADLKGSFSAHLDPDKVQQVLRQINVEVTRRLGYPRIVQSGHTTQAAGQLAAAYPR